MKKVIKQDNDGSHYSYVLYVEEFLHWNVIYHVTVLLILNVKVTTVHRIAIIICVITFYCYNPTSPNFVIAPVC